MICSSVETVFTPGEATQFPLKSSTFVGQLKRWNGRSLVMKVCMIGCWYKKDVYSHNWNQVVRRVSGEKNFSVRTVTSNCNCFSSSQKYGICKDELLNDDCDVVKIPYAPLEPNPAYGVFKCAVVKYLRVNYLLEVLRGFAFFSKSRGCDVIHFDQVLRSFGIVSLSILLVLAKTAGKKIIVTVHELDPLQSRFPVFNKFYNLADKITVYSADLKTQLLEFGVSNDKVVVIPYGVSVEPLMDNPRDKFVYFGGHKLLTGKGFDTLLHALKILESKGKEIKVLVYVGEGCIGHDEGKKMVTDMDLDSFVQWSDFLYSNRLTETYQQSFACIIPYTGSSGKYPATCAMANATPVIATRKAGLPEYLGELGIYIRENSPDELAAAMIASMEDDDSMAQLRADLRRRAVKYYSYNVTVGTVLKVYDDLFA